MPCAFAVSVCCAAIVSGAPNSMCSTCKNAAAARHKASCAVLIGDGSVACMARCRAMIRVAGEGADRFFAKVFPSVLYERRRVPR